MSSAGQTADCEAMMELLVDCADGSAGAERFALVEAHCAQCQRCSDALVGLREIPVLLRGEDEPPDVAWDGQRARILAIVGEIAAADAERTRGFDARILLPLVAGLCIALAGVVSLQSGRGGEPARAALLLAMEDPEMSAELSELLGEPLLLSDPLWAAEGGLEGDVERNPGELEETPTVDELSHDVSTARGRTLGA